MRERTTWNRDQIVKLAQSLKKAEDPRAMNQDHLKQQPAADKYEIGGPSEFGEDVHPSTGTWKAEYSGGEVKRNEIGMPELRGDTFNHSEKTAGQDDDEEDDDFLEKKADVCLSIAKRMLPKSASAQMIEDQAFAFMHMADADIVATHARLAAQDEDDKGQQDKAQQDKEAGQIPENFKKKDDEGKDDKAQQDKEAGQIPENFKKDEDKKDDDKGQQSKEAQGQQQKQDDDKKQSQGQQDQDDDKKQASDKIAALQKQACDALMSGDQQGAQQAVQQIAQLQQGQQQQQLSQEQAQQQVQQMLSQALQQQGQPQQQLGDDQMLDQMLQQQMAASTDTSMLTATTGPMMDIQLEGPSMDMTEVRLGSEDEALTALFASHDEVQQAAHAHSLQNGFPVQASAPASMSRTASTRTVGTRPTGGVAQLGGASAPSSGGEIDKLAGLWASAPNVKSVFDT